MRITTKISAALLAAVAVSGATVTSSQNYAEAAPVATAAPVIYMERVVVQSQVEPVYGESRIAGDFGVKQVQKALKSKGYGTTVDGWFGVSTRSDYSTWQRSLGYGGIDANGIPGPDSLTKLGKNRFQVQRKILVGSKTTHSGKTVNQRTKNMLREAESKLSRSITVTQGSYQGCSPASACTHAGGGVVDISVSGLSTTQRWQTVRALRQVGFAAWLRTPQQGNWPYHIHAVAVGDTAMHREAANQVADYYAGKNGLANHAPDNTPSAYKASFKWWEWYKRTK